MRAGNEFAPFVREDGCWVQSRLMGEPSQFAPILFLDRDGVVVEEVNYLHRIKDVRFLSGVVELISSARVAGWRVALVTNQAGIGRGYYSWDEFAIVNEYILSALDHQGAFIDAVLAVPHHPEGLGDFRHPDHSMRKPNPGMLLAAGLILKGDFSRSIIVGDNTSDLLAGQRAGLRRGFAVLSGHGQRYREESERLNSIEFSVDVVSHAGSNDILKIFKSDTYVGGLSEQNVHPAN